MSDRVRLADFKTFLVHDGYRTFVFLKLYTDDGLQPGFMAHDEYVAFMNQFGNDTAAFLQESGVIQR